MRISPLVDARDPDRFGGKAANLAVLANGYPVPPGFAVSADATEDEIRAAVPAAYAALGREGHAIAESDVAVAVRSSAIGEDSRDASFAGQHETLLNVRGRKAVIEAILQVRRSASSERAVAYRRERGIDGTPRVGVLVQRMVDADASVIAFTADPVTGDADLVVINACRGLGDAMASGEVTPDMIQVRKSDLEPVFGGTRGSAVLSHEQVRGVARLAIALERDAAHPVDIEAAFAGGTLYLLQSRPVTAAGERDGGFPVAWSSPADAELTWQLEDAHFSRASLPLSLDYSSRGPGTGIQRRNESLGMPVRFRWQEFSGYVYVANQLLAAPDEVQRKTALVLEGRVERARALARAWPERYLPAVLAQHEWIRALRPLGLTAEKAALAWEDMWRRVSDIWEIHMTTTGGAYGIMAVLAQTYASLTGRPPEEAFTLTHGRAHTLQQLQRDMFVLAEAVRSLSHVAEAIRAGVEARDVLRELPGGARFDHALETFLARHGDLGQPYESVPEPAWSDEPSLLIREIRRALEVPPADSDIRLARLLAQSEATALRVRETLRDRGEELARFEDLLEIARAVGPLTEEHNYWIDRRTQAAVRRAALRFGERLVADGSIERAEDAYHLYVTEIAGALRHPRDLHGLIREREARHARNQRLRPPPFLGAPPQAPGGTPPGLIPRSDLGYKEKQDDPNVLKGVPASAGVGRGLARLVRGNADLDKVRAGDVLVCHATTVSYVPVFGKVAAVVTEVGGSLSHAAVVAREFGVPCVVATSVALTFLHDGEHVEVDGSVGVVRRVPAGVVAAS